jgi:hypothetical protein
VEEVLDVASVDGSEVMKAYVLVNSVDSKGKWASVLGGSAGYRRWENGEARVDITLNMNGAISPAEYLEIPAPGSGFKTIRIQPLSSCTHETCLNYGLYSILIHEVTHAAESMFKGKGLSYSYDENRKVNDETAYMNDPKEIRAFMQQIVDETSRSATVPVIRDHSNRDNQKLLNLCLKLSTTWKIIHASLTPTNRAKILKAVYGELASSGLLF